MTFHVGGTLKINVPIEGDISPEISWFKDGKKVLGHGNVSLETTDYMASLTTKRITRDDAGEYECVAKNDWGSSRVKSIVHIMGKY